MATVLSEISEPQLPPALPPLSEELAAQIAAYVHAQIELHLAAHLTTHGTQVGALQAEIQRLTLVIARLRTQLWGRSSERSRHDADDPTVLDLFVGAGVRLPELPDVPATHSTSKPDTGDALTNALKPARRARPRGPRAIDPDAFPDLPREVVRLPDPDEARRVCPLTQHPLTPGWTESLAVLRRKKPEYSVTVYERTVWVSPLKAAPLTTPWPATVWPRSHVDVSIVAHVATAHFIDHLPYHRTEHQTARQGAALPRSTQVSLMKELAERLAPLVELCAREVFTSRYLHVDATPLLVLDPQQRHAHRHRKPTQPHHLPRRTLEGCLWLYCVGGGPDPTDPDTDRVGTVLVKYHLDKSPEHPKRLLRATGFAGILQTDGATGFEPKGPPQPGEPVHIGCWAHARRYFFHAVEAGDRQALPYLRAINRLFTIERRAFAHAITTERQQAWRQRYSLPLVEALYAQAERDQQTTCAPQLTTYVTRRGQTKTKTKKTTPTLFAKALTYLLNQREPLRRALTTPGTKIHNNPVEQAIRPIKVGERNWLFLGSPDAGERFAVIYTIMANCRLAQVDPEAYLIDILPRLDACAAIADSRLRQQRLRALLPRHWKAQHQPQHQSTPAITLSARCAA